MKLKITYLFIAFSCLSLSSQAQLRENMVLNFPLNGNVLDYSGNTNDAVIMDATPFINRFNTNQSAFLFDGIDDHIEIPNNSAMKPELPLTISMWVYPEEISTVSNKLFASDDHPDFYSGVFVQLNPSNSGTLSFSYGTGSGSGFQHRRTVFGSTPLELETWTHVVGVIKGPEDMDIYINGVQDSVTYSGTSNGSIVYTDSPGRIGAFDASGNGDMQYFYGAIDEVKMWDVALTEADIKTIYNELVWDMPAQNDAIDYSGNMIDGTVINCEPSEDRFGNTNEAWSFNGVDTHIEIPDNPYFKPQIPFSISMWVNIDDINYPDNVFFANDDTDNFYSGINMRLHHIGEGTISMSYGTGGGSGPNNRRTASGTTSIESQKWYHVVGICRGPQDMDLYINGVKDSVVYSGNGGAMIYTDSPGRLGAYDGNINGDRRYMAGKLDELKMWHRAISAEEIEILYTPGISTGVRDNNINLSNKINLYPNPAIDVINIQSSLKESIELCQIYNTQGQLIKTMNFSNQINIRDLDSGLYILRMRTKTTQVNKHFVVL